MSIQNTGLVLLAIPGSLPVKISIYIYIPWLKSTISQTYQLLKVLFCFISSPKLGEKKQVHVCLHECLCVCVYAIKCVCVCVQVNVCLCASVCVIVFRAPHNPKSVYIHALACVLCVSVCLCVCVCVCVCVMGKGGGCFLTSSSCMDSCILDLTAIVWPVSIIHFHHLTEITSV